MVDAISLCSLCSLTPYLISETNGAFQVIGILSLKPLVLTFKLVLKFTPPTAPDIAPNTPSAITFLSDSVPQKVLAVSVRLSIKLVSNVSFGLN